jgi:hypothetical protein
MSSAADSSSSAQARNVFWPSAPWDRCRSRSASYRSANRASSLTTACRTGNTVSGSAFATSGVRNRGFLVVKMA